MFSPSSSPGSPAPPSTVSNLPANGNELNSAVMSFLPAALQGNPYFEAGFGLSVVGTLLAAARGGAKVAVGMTKRHFLVTLEITSKDRAYPWVLAWLTRQASLGRQFGSASTLAQHVSVTTSTKGSGVDSSGGDSSGDVSAGQSSGDIRFDFAPCPGRHFVGYKGRLLRVERVRADQAMMDFNTGLPFETVKLATLGRSRVVFEELLEEASREALDQERLHTIVYKSWGTEWQPFGKPRLRRPLSSVILEAGTAESIMQDFAQFTQSRNWYVERGIPYRRGYLLHGPPGSGKTSFITALAGELGFDICVLNLGEAGLTDDRLAHALSNMPPRAFALLEDVDAAFVRRDAADTSQSRSYVTFSGLLNALDGVAAGEERVVFMTTNHLNKLDPALVRPGRADVLKLIGDATPEQASRMFLKFHPGEDEAAEHFATALSSASGPSEPPPRISMAMLQGFFMTHRQDGAMGCLQNTHALLEEARMLAQLQDQLSEAKEKAGQQETAFVK